MKELDPIIRKISEHYGFDIKYDEEFDMWIITNSTRKYSDFYWNSDYPFEEFLDDIKDYFYDAGYDMGSRY